MTLICMIKMMYWTWKDGTWREERQASPLDRLRGSLLWKALWALAGEDACRLWEESPDFGEERQASPLDRLRGSLLWKARARCLFRGRVLRAPSWWLRRRGPGPKWGAGPPP